MSKLFIFAFGVFVTGLVLSIVGKLELMGTDSADDLVRLGMIIKGSALIALLIEYVRNIKQSDKG